MSFSMPSEVMYGSIPVSTKTPLGKELWPHERKPDYNPDEHPYPKMLYRAYEQEDGRIRFIEGHPKPFLFVNPEQYRQACEEIDNFNLTCQLTVGKDGPENLEASRAEQRRAEADGWRENPDKAKERIRDLHRDIVKAATETAYRNRNMSPGANAEWAAAEAETPHVIAELPEKPTVKKMHWKTAQKLAKESAGV